MKSKRNRLLFSLLLLMLIIGTFFSWKIYQDRSRAFIDVADLDNVELIRRDNQYYIVGDADLPTFERVANYGAIQIDDAIYIYITKTKAIIGNQEIEENISNILQKDNTIEPQKVYLISGSDIKVEPTENSTEDYYDVTRYSDKKELLIPE